MASALYGAGWAAFFTEPIDWNSDTLKVGLLTSSYSPNADTDVYWSDISANEVSGTNYTAGGATLSSPTSTATAANSWGTTYATATAYALNKVVIPTTPNGYLYRASVAGTSSGSEPTWPTTVGATVTDNTVTWTNIGKRVVVLDAADVSWATATITARYAVVYKSTGVAGTSRLLILEDFSSDKTSTAGTFQVTWDSQGIVVIGLP